MPVKIVSIAFETMTGEDELFIDNIFIGEDPDSCK